MSIAHARSLVQSGRPTLTVVIGSSNAAVDFAGCTRQLERQATCHSLDHRLRGRRTLGWAAAYVKRLRERHGGSGGGGGGSSGGGGRDWTIDADTRHELVTMGRSGCAADCFVDCLETHLGLVERPVSLFVLEFAITTSTPPQRQALDALITRLAATGASLLCVHFWPFCKRDFECTRFDSTASHLRTADDVPEAYSAAAATCARHNVTSVSTRDILLPAMLNGSVPLTNGLQVADYGFHPSPYARKVLGAAIYDAVVRTPMSSASFDRPQARVSPVLACYDWLDVNSSEALADWSQKSYRMVAPPPTLSSVGWRHTREGHVTADGRVKSRTGLVSGGPGGTGGVATLRVSVHAGGEGWRRARLTFLRSSAPQMGVLRLSCEPPCFCRAAVNASALLRSVEAAQSFGIYKGAAVPSACVLEMQTDGGRFVLFTLSIRRTERKARQWQRQAEAEGKP